MQVGSDNFGAGQGFTWFARSIGKPRITYNRSGLDGKRIFNQVADFKPVALDSVPTLQDVTLTLIDPSYPSVTKQIMQIMNQSGMGHKNGYGYNRYVASNYLEPFIISQLSHKPEDSELFTSHGWVLDEPVIIDVDFGSLDYSSDKFVDIKLTIGYSGFTFVSREFSGTPDNKNVLAEFYSNSRLKQSAERPTNEIDNAFNKDSLDIFSLEDSQNKGVNFTGKP